MRSIVICTMDHHECFNVQVKFHIKDMIFRIHDVGGQRSERRKWLYLFDCVHAVRVVIIVNHVTMQVWESVYQYGLRLIYNIQVCILGLGEKSKIKIKTFALGF